MQCADRQPSAAEGQSLTVDAGLQVCLDKYHGAAEALAEHFAQKNDDAGFELLDELLEY